MSDYKDYGYHDSKSTYAHQYITESILNLLNQNDKLTILDLGCGNGALVNGLIDRGFDAYGTDASEMGIKIASRLHPNRFALQDLSQEELPEKFSHINFNIIISTEVIEHLYDPRKFITFCKKILIKNGGGELILSTPYHGYLKNILLSIFGKWDTHANPLWDGGHIKLWSRKTLSQLVIEQGFTVTDFIGCGRLPYVWKSMIIKAKI
ncbi:methyltransferase domain-containing protein [Pedobacter sp. Du54]|uniref:class I SAM-dependent methyltransferase n=1 Tax=Pedobacter anseongensis TaxID=3133439 RepID=UPI0030B0821E